MGFADREKNRAGRGVVAAMISEPEQTTTPTTKGRPKAERETKKRVSLAILPSLYEDIQKIAYVERKSISQITEECFEKYAAEKADKLKEYDKLKQK